MHSRTCDGVRGEGLPDDALADVGRDEEGDARAEAVALLEQLIETDDDDARKEELHQTYFSFVWGKVDRNDQSPVLWKRSNPLRHNEDACKKRLQET